jgi:hypothetical protein
MSITNRKIFLVFIILVKYKLQRYGKTFKRLKIGISINHEKF